MPKPLKHEPTLKGQRVLIVGGGLAGLAASRELIARGADVHVLEARARLGGRVWSVLDRDFSDTPLEIGGEFIDGDHEAIRALCHEYRLTLQPVLREGFGIALDANGRVQMFNSLRNVWSEFKHALTIEREAFEKAECDWNSGVAQMIGRHSLLAVLQARGASRETIAMAQGLKGFFLADADQLSALVGVEQSLAPKDPGHVNVSRIKGGNDKLVQALSKQKGLKITMSTVVDAIEHDAKEVRVHVADGSKKGATLKADYLVLAVPAPIARAMELTPAVPASLRRAWQALTSGPATKAHARFDKGWWRKPGRPRAWGTNLDTGAIWEVAGTGPACLTFLAGGRASQGFRALVEEGGPQRMVRRLAWLGDVEEARDFRSMTWELDPFAKGGYAVFGPDFKPEWRSEMERPFGRIAFAGEHTSRDWQGYMNGAVESGQRAARDIEMMQRMELPSAPA